jgi:hypothetical protein
LSLEEKAKMVNGVAVKLSDTADGRPVFQLYPSRGMDESSRQYVVADTVDGGGWVAEKHTTLHFCDASGDVSMFTPTEALAPHLRLVGLDIGVDQAIANLGYVLIGKHDLEGLQVLGKAAALEWYRANISVSGETDYAEQNWGIFAAEYLVSSRKVDKPVARRNQVPWQKHESRHARQMHREREAYSEYLVG